LHKLENEIKSRLTERTPKTEENIVNAMRQTNGSTIGLTFYPTTNAYNKFGKQISVSKFHDLDFKIHKIEGESKVKNVPLDLVYLADSLTKDQADFDTLKKELIENGVLTSDIWEIFVIT